MGNCLSFLYPKNTGQDCDDDRLPNDPLPLMERGVRLEVLMDILKNLNDDHRIIASRALKRTPSNGETIVHGIVKTVAKNQSYATFLKENPDTADMIGKINIFVSHAWSSTFKGTVESIEAFEAQLPDDAPPCFYFVDFFSINQYDAEKDLKQLKLIVQESQKLLLMATPWRKPVTLGRAWCIFELGNAVLGETEVVLTMTAEGKSDFMKSVEQITTSYDMEFLLSSLTEIDSKNSEASVKSDLEMIKNFIMDKLGGFDLVDQKVGDALRQWIAESLKMWCESYKPWGTPKHCSFLSSSCFFFLTFGMWEYMLKCGQLSVKIAEDFGVYYGGGKKNVALALEYLGRFSEAIAMRKLILKKSIEKNGPKHKETLQDRRLLGAAYMAASQWDKAEVEIRSVLKVYQEIHEPMHYRIRIAQDHLAIILRDSGKDIDEAQKLFKELLDQNIKEFGVEDPTVLINAVQHARCLDLRGYHATALQTYNQAWPTILRTWGENDKDVKMVRRWIVQAKSRTVEKKE